MDYTTGSFGVPSNNNDFGQYMFGAQEPGNTIPPYSVAKQDTMQYMYQPTNYSSPTMKYQSPTYSAHTYGVKDSVVHDMLGKHHQPNINFLHHQQSKNEYKQIAKDSAAWDMAGIGAGAAAFAVGSLPIGLAASVAIESTVGAMKEEHFDNYRLTQRVNRMTGGIRGKSGAYGLSGGDNADIAKFIKNESAKDVMLSQDDFEGILSTAQDSGLLNAVGSGEQFKSKASEMKNAIKDLMSALGSSNIKDLMATMGEFSRMGVGTTAGQKGMVKMMGMSARFAGIGKDEMHDQMMNAVANGDAVGIDSRISASNMIGIMSGMTMMQQGGQLSSKLLDKTAYASAAQKSDFAVSAFNEGMTGGITTDLKIIYAGKKAKENGTTAQEELNKFSSMSTGEQSSAFFKEMGNDRELADAYYFKNTAAAKARQVKGIGKNSTRAMDFAAAFDTAAQMVGKDASSDEIVNMFNYNEKASQYLDANGMEISMAQGKIYKAALKRSGGNRGYAIRQLSAGEDTAREMQQIEDDYNNREKEKESKHLWTKAEKGWSAVKNYVSQSMGGFDSAGTSIDKSRKLFGAIYAGDQESRSNSMYASVNKIGADRQKVDKMANLAFDLEQKKIDKVAIAKVEFDAQRNSNTKEVFGPLADRFNNFSLFNDDPSRGMFSAANEKRKNGPTQYTLDSLSSENIQGLVGGRDYRQILDISAGKKLNTLEAMAETKGRAGGGIVGSAAAAIVGVRGAMDMASEVMPYMKPGLMALDKMASTGLQKHYDKQIKNDWGVHLLSDKTHRGNMRLMAEREAQNSGKSKIEGQYGPEVAQLAAEYEEKGMDSSIIQKYDGTRVKTNKASNDAVKKIIDKGQLTEGIAPERAFDVGIDALEFNEKTKKYEEIKPSGFSQPYSEKTFLGAGSMLAATEGKISAKEQDKEMSRLGIAIEDHDLMRKKSKETEFGELSKAGAERLSQKDDKELWTATVDFAKTGKYGKETSTATLVRKMKSDSSSLEEKEGARQEIFARNDGTTIGAVKEKLSSDEKEWLKGNKEKVSAYANLVSVNAEINKDTGGKGESETNLKLLSGMSRDSAVKYIEGSDWSDKQKQDMLKAVDGVQKGESLSDDDINTLSKAVKNDATEVSEKFGKSFAKSAGITSAQYDKLRAIGHETGLNDLEKKDKADKYLSKASGKAQTVGDVMDQMASDKIFRDDEREKAGIGATDMLSASEGDSTLMIASIASDTKVISKHLEFLAN